MAHPARARESTPEEVAARTSSDLPGRPPSQKRAPDPKSGARRDRRCRQYRCPQGGARIFVPVVSGIVIALALGPIVRRLAKIMPRWIASAVVVFALAGVLGFMAYSLSDEASQAVARTSARDAGPAPDVSNSDHPRRGRFHNCSAPLRNCRRRQRNRLNARRRRAASRRCRWSNRPLISRTLSGTDRRARWLSWAAALLVGFLVYFLLASGDLFKRKLMTERRTPVTAQSHRSG